MSILPGNGAEARRVTAFDPGFQPWVDIYTRLLDRHGDTPLPAIPSGRRCWLDPDARLSELQSLFDRQMQSQTVVLAQLDRTETRSEASERKG